MRKTDYAVLTEMECAKEVGLTYTVDEESILYDLKFLLSEFYIATFRKNGNGLKLKFNNGQTFVLSAKEVK